MVLVGGLVGALNGVIGLYVSYHFDVAGGGSVVLVTTAFFFVVFALAPNHGLLAQYIRRRPEPPADELSPRGLPGATA
jgi:hypothetical protein